jgi:single-strand DNA-binding protein
MARSFNRVILVGNLTRDVELRHTSSSTAVTDLGLAVNDRRKTPQGEWVDEVTYVDITLWGRQAEVASEYLSKGSRVLIEGRLQLDQWQDKDSGQQRSKLKVVGSQMMMLGGRGEEGGQRGSSGDSDDAYSGPAETTSQPSSTPTDDDIPF